MFVDKRVNAGSRLDGALDDALVFNIVEVGLQGSKHRGRAVLLDVLRPCWRRKSLGQKVGTPALYLDALVFTVADDGEHARYDGRIVSTVA